METIIIIIIIIIIISFTYLDSNTLNDWPLNLYFET